MSPANNGESALGMGLDALIRKEKPEKQDKSVKEASNTRKAPAKTSTKKPKKTKKAAKTQTDPNKPIMDNVVLEVRKNPRISLWSARSAAVLRFLKNTKPAFSISKEASALIEEAVQEKYPEIWEMFKDEEF
ncbi:MAG: AAA family ATPase [Methanobacterium sp.]|nr:AAA family ATPase [Methanobacterium sp.]